jgi:hypothetical protein
VPDGKDGPPSPYLPPIAPEDLQFELSDQKEALRLAADDVRRIRAIWQLDYNGRKNRREPPSAEDIAAWRWGIEDDADTSATEKIINFMK